MSIAYIVSAIGVMVAATVGALILGATKPETADAAAAQEPNLVG